MTDQCFDKDEFKIMLESLETYKCFLENTTNEFEQIDDDSIETVIRKLKLLIKLSNNKIGS